MKIEYEQAITTNNVSRYSYMILYNLNLLSTEGYSSQKRFFSDVPCTELHHVRLWYLGEQQALRSGQWALCILPRASCFCQVCGRYSTNENNNKSRYMSVGSFTFLCVLTIRELFGDDQGSYTPIHTCVQADWSFADSFPNHSTHNGTLASVSALRSYDIYNCCETAPSSQFIEVP